MKHAMFAAPTRGKQARTHRTQILSSILDDVSLGMFHLASIEELILQRDARY